MPSSLVGMGEGFTGDIGIWDIRKASYTKRWEMGFKNLLSVSSKSQETDFGGVWVSFVDHPLMPRVMSNLCLNEYVNDYRSYEHHVSSSENKAWKTSEVAGTNPVHA